MSDVAGLCELMVKYGLSRLQAGDVVLERPPHVVAVSQDPEPEFPPGEVDQETFLSWPEDKRERYLRGGQIK